MSQISSIFKDGSIREYPKGQIVLYQGEQTSDVFMIESGYVKVYDVTQQGSEKLLMILGAGDVFPLVWAFGGSERLHYFYQTIDETKLSVMPRDTFIETVRKSQDYSMEMLEYFVERTRQLMSRIECIDATSARHKVAQVLSYLAEAQGEEITTDTYKIKLPITHQSIADMAGVTRETASIQLKALEKKKLFSSKDDSLIVHTDRVEEFLG